MPGPPPETPALAAEVGPSLPDSGDGRTADPRQVGELLSVWLGIQMASVDDLVAEARDKVDAIPKWSTLAQIVGELTIRVHCLETEVAQLKGLRP